MHKNSGNDPIGGKRLAAAEPEVAIDVLIDAPDLASAATVSSRQRLLRYFNLYRIIVASVLVIFGSIFQFGLHSPQLYAAAVGIYWLAAIAFLWLKPPAGNRLDQVLLLQVAIDIAVLTVVMHTSGGYRTGMPFMMMVVVAGAGLVAEGRMVSFFAALATIAVLGEQGVRLAREMDFNADFTSAGITGMGFFAVALMARLLVRRAQTHEVIARQRGHALQSQILINARIIEDMLDGVVVANAKGMLLQANPRARQLLGDDLHPGDKLEKISPVLHAFFERQNRSVMPVFRAEHTGKLIRLRGLTSGEEGSQVFFLEDVERIQAQAQQLKLAALGRLTANIAHEIRNPLTSITQAGELLQEEKRGEMRQRLIRIIRDNGARIERIVKEVLELGRRDFTTPEALELHRFLHAYVEDVSLHDAHIKQLVTLSIPEALKVRFDRVHLQQILWNLIGNARRFCNGSAGSIRIWVRELNERYIALHISDNGPGIAQSEHGKVFEPFFTTDPQGTGLGLYVARELAETNGGNLELSAAPGGADFYLTMERAS